MPTDRMFFVIEPRRFSLMVEGQIRHHITAAPILEGEEIVFQAVGTSRKAIFLVTFVDENTYDVHGDEFKVYTAALKLQEWASPDTQ